MSSPPARGTSSPRRRGSRTSWSGSWPRSARRLRGRRRRDQPGADLLVDLRVVEQCEVVCPGYVEAVLVPEAQATRPTAAGGAWAQNEDVADDAAYRVPVASHAG